MLRQGRGRRFGCARGGTTEAWRRGGVDEDEGERGGGGEEEEERRRRRRRRKVTVGRAGICRTWKHEVDTCYVK